MDERFTIRPQLATEIKFSFGKDRSRWFRFKALIGWIWFGEAVL